MKLKVLPEVYERRLERMRKFIELWQTGDHIDSAIAKEVTFLASSFDYSWRERLDFIRKLLY